MEEIAREQKITGENIEKISTNYKKDPPERKTRTYYEKRIANLDKLWIQFQSRDSQLAQFKETDSDHPYFQKQFFQQVQKIYKQTKHILDVNLEVLKQKEEGEDKGEEDEDDEDEEEDDEDKKGNKREDRNRNTLRSKKQQESTKVLLRIIKSIEDNRGQQQPKAYYLQKLQILNTYWATITANHLEIIAHATTEDEQSDYIANNRFSELEDIYQSTVIELQRRCDETLAAEQATIYSSSSEQQEARHNPPSMQKIKIAPLNVPTFSGSYYDWKSFYDLFSQLIHDNESLGKAQKMNYLKSNISGDAAKLLQHLPITDQNYDVAWELLKNRYNNPRLLLSAQLQTLLSQQTIKAESAYEIRKLHDTTKQCLLAIKYLNVNTTGWDPIIIHILLQKLDKETHRLYEYTLKSPREIPKLDEMLSFLESRFQTLEAITNKDRRDIQPSPASSYQPRGPRQSKFALRSFHNTAKSSCVLCKSEHKIYGCNKFLNMDNKQRMDTIRRHKLCSNCLQPHNISQCKSTSTCRICHQKHNTLLHSTEARTDSRNQTTSHVATTNNSQPTASPNRNTMSSGDNQIQIRSHFADNHVAGTKVLLATALVKVTSYNGSQELLRALIDQGSQASFISEDCAQRLRLKRTKVYASVLGLGSADAGTARSSVQMQVQPRFTSSFTLTVTALVLSKLTKLLPSNSTQTTNTQHIENILLADPTYDRPGPIDIILGADAYGEIIMNGIIKGPIGTPIAQRTELGWILSGCMRNTKESKTLLCLVAQADIEEQLKMFWKIEEVSTKDIITPEELECEEFYKRTVKRQSDGRYIVRIPFNSNLKDTTTLGSTREKALARLLQMERKFTTNNQLGTDYRQFMREYEELGHFVESNKGSLERQDRYHLPHHAVVKEESSTTKLRVVFDASAKSTTNTSLNDITLTGPQIQQDLSTILLRWRKHKVAYTADVEKMYRQILIAKDDQGYQTILWRNSPSESIREYNLTTVTYGTRSAPFLAVRTLQQLAIDDGHLYQTAAAITQNDFYVDDLLSGNDSLEEALKSQQEIVNLLAGGGFNLRKWTSNYPQMLENIPSDLQAKSPPQFKVNETVKTLGIHWQPTTDLFEFKVNLPPIKKSPTKRTVLSEASKLFDPLGWLAPIIVETKIMFQELWLTGVQWDQDLPEKLAERWIRFQQELPTIEKIRIPRWVKYSKTCQTYELHGFCDASERAYAEVVYAKTIHRDGSVN